MRRLIAAASAALVLGLTGLSPAALAATEGAALPHTDFPHVGVFGKYDKPALKRGLQVYREVCSACHGLKHIAFRNLTALGLSDDEIKAIAETYQIQDGPNDEGEMFERAGRPSDYFPNPFANEKAARASNNGAYPPDLSLITKGRDGHEGYVYAILTGYEEPPADFALGEGMNYNKYFPGHQIAMAPPLNDGQVTYEDGTEAKVATMAHDVVTFLAWAAEPELEERKAVGLKVLIFIGLLTAVLYAINVRIWSRVT
ncbi:MAG: cytochrome c1 [Alphaproteobacteria bacterium]|nr:cytochrome c1 [Alphaproteobacteria bacterium]